MKQAIKTWLTKSEDFYFLHIRKYVKIQQLNALHIFYTH